jgi:hypothetical protein
MSVANEENEVKMDDLRSLNTLEDIKFAVRRIEELEAKLAEVGEMKRLLAMDKINLRGELAWVEGKLQHQTHLIEQLFALLDKTEETDDGIVFHPNQLRSCRAADTEKLSKILAELRSPMKGQKDD